MKFSDMPYERIELPQLRQEGERWLTALRQAQTAEQAEQAMLGWDRLSGHVTTLSNLAYIRHSIDTADPFYDGEIAYWDEVQPKISEIGQQFAQGLLQSPFRPALEQKYGTLLFLNAEIGQKAFSPEIIPEMQEENQQTTAYQKLIASAQIPFDGKTLTLSQLTPYKQSPDDGVRRAAWAAESAFFQENADELDALYDRLVALRTAMARRMGYPDFRTLGYYRMLRNSYTPEDVEQFRKAVRTHIVPVADRLYREQAKRTGCPYPLSFADAALTFRSGNAKPQGSPEEILAHGRTMYHELSPETAAFIDFLYDNELLDVLSKKGKAGGGYCTSLPDYKAPFVFANFNGTSGDVEVITHEAGHAFADYMARDIVPSDNQSPTLESCEIHSMTMEFFGWRWAPGFFGRDTEKFYYGHLASAVKFLPYGCLVDHFQHVVYERPELTPDERHGVWRELMGQYMPWMALDGSPFYGEGHGWQRQSHIYEVPFYYIDYCLAQTVALEFWVQMQRDPADAWERYLRLVKQAGTKTFDGLVRTAGLRSPFESGTLQEVAQAASSWLDAANPRQWD